MKLSSIQLSVLLIVASLICGFSWYKFKQQYITQQELFAQIESAYSRQFCTVVFPNLKTCLMATVEQCLALVQTAIRPCFDSLKKALPENINKNVFKETHARVAECFEINMHNEIMQKYLVKSKECWDKMS